MPKINKIIKILIGADLMFMSASGFIAPIFAVFLVESIAGGSVQLAGTAAAIYWLTKSILRIPIAYCLDKNRGEHDDFYAMITGFSIYTICYFLYFFASVPSHIYAIQLLMGVGGAFAFTPWYGFFSRHIDKYRENFEWSLEVSFVGFGIAGAGYAAGIIAENFGFAPLFLIGGTLSFLGTLFLLFIGKNIKIKKVDGLAAEVRE